MSDPRHRDMMAAQAPACQLGARAEDNYTNASPIAGRQLVPAAGATKCARPSTGGGVSLRRWLLYLSAMLASDQTRSKTGFCRLG
jgi:hypothetical protein